MEIIMNGIESFQKGGVTMYVLLLCSIFAVAIAIERFKFFVQADAGREFAQKFYDCLTDQKYEDALQLAKETHGVLPKLLSDAIALSRTHTGTNDLTAYLEIQSVIMFAHLRRRLYYLNVIASMSPLLGLLGTILGMISALSMFQFGSGQVSAITGGIGEALISTAFGLCVAILALALHSYFTQRVDNVVADTEQCCAILEGERERIFASGRSSKDSKGGAKA